MLDIFRDNAFSLGQLTKAILKAPYKPGRVGEMGLFRSQGIRTTTVIIEEKDGQLDLIQSKPRGGVASQLGTNKRTARSFLVPHLPKQATIMADEVQGVRAFGSENELEAIQTVVDQKLGILRASHEVTHEHMRIRALQGIILDADGTTLFNLFTEFGVAQQSAVLHPNPAADEFDALRNEVVAVQRLIENELGAEMVSGYHAFCGATFFDTLRADVGITNTLRYADPASLLAQQANARRFSFGGVTWEEYRGSTGGTPFVAAGEAFVFPTGTDIFQTYFAPADYVETVNTIGLPVYVKQRLLEFDKGVQLDSQSNPLMLNTRPRATVKLTLG
jgi:hypothetical protein